MLALLSFLLIILIVVSIHEYGHYLVARFFSVRVIRFSVGFGKPLWKKVDKQKTEWVLATFPLGGYVQMLDKDLAERHGYPYEETIESRQPWQRILIYFAGPAANFILSAFLLFVLLLGGEVGLRPTVGDIVPHSPIDQSGISIGASITEVNNQPTPLWRYVEKAMLDAVIVGEPILLKTDAGTQYSVATDSILLDEVKRGGANLLGMFPDDSYILPKVHTVILGSPADKAGLIAGDTLVKIGENIVDHWRDALTVIIAHPETEIDLVVWREGQAITLKPTLESNVVNGEKIGWLGIAPTIDKDLLNNLVVTISRSPLQLVADTITQTGANILQTFHFVRLIFSGKISANNVSGPVGIAVQSGVVAELGLKPWLHFVALISISLAVINLLPIPLLDGGQIVLNMLQCLMRGRVFSQKFLTLWNGVGVFFILMLTTWAIFNDLFRFVFE